MSYGASRFWPSSASWQGFFLRSTIASRDGCPHPMCYPEAAWSREGWGSDKAKRLHPRRSDIAWKLPGPRPMLKQCREVVFIADDLGFWARDPSAPFFSHRRHCKEFQQQEAILAIFHRKKALQPQACHYHIKVAATRTLSLRKRKTNRSPPIANNRRSTVRSVRPSRPPYTALSSPRHCTEANIILCTTTVTTHHDASAKQEGILGPKHGKSATSRSVTWCCMTCARHQFGCSFLPTIGSVLLTVELLYLQLTLLAFLLTVGVFP